ncbi:MAG: ferrochelatase [Proteobacteria bacterium]|nr:ferrochelatase [Pseudomonadota bacterium]
MARTAIVLFNLGGPDGPRAVRPFLFNLFNDPAIIGAPGPLRWLLAQGISRRRAPVTRRIYDELGGGSPLLANTEAQARALEAVLNAQTGGNAQTGDGEVKAFVAMRYWHPMSEETARAVKAYDPERVVLLPLYPQFSTTTTGSSIAAWAGAAARVGLEVPTRALCCYPTEPGFVAEVAGQLRSALAQAAGHGAPRVLFSAHGLPKKIVERGDPYQWQVERTVAAVVEALGQGDLDWRICYQSRVGPLEWIGPSTEAEIARAGRDGVALVVVPIAFVSEHSETLVELDIEYRRLAREAGVPVYIRAPTVGAGAAFIAGLADLVRQALADPRPLRSQAGGRLCPPSCSGCPQGAV